MSADRLGDALAAPLPDEVGVDVLDGEAAHVR